MFLSRFFNVIATVNGFKKTIEGSTKDSSIGIRFAQNEKIAFAAEQRVQQEI